MIEEQYSRILNYGKGRLETDMQIVILCEKMGWTFQQYEEQPRWFIKLLASKMSMDNQYEKAKQRS